MREICLLAVMCDFTLMYCFQYDCMLSNPLVVVEHITQEAIRCMQSKSDTQKYVDAWTSEHFIAKS